jgi:hypothetical protein
MQFEIANTPGSLQKMSNNILKNIIDLSIITNIYNILLFTKIKEEYRKLFKEVLSYLQKMIKAISIDKYEFNNSDIEFKG